MAKLKLIPDPTFKAPVNIPVAGGQPVPVIFEFRHRTKDALRGYLESLDGKSEIDVIQEVAVGWELDDDFNTENIAVLTQNYPRASYAVHGVYIGELLGAKLKN